MAKSLNPGVPEYLAQLLLAVQFAAAAWRRTLRTRGVATCCTSTSGWQKRCAGEQHQPTLAALQKQFYRSTYNKIDAKKTQKTCEQQYIFPKR